MYKTNNKLLETKDNIISNIKQLQFECDKYDEEKQKKYVIRTVNWINEILVKNKMILHDHTKETVGRKRQHVYYIDFGVNIGSEFNYPHFCVVIKEFKYTAIVVPLSTVKEEDKEWKNAENLIIPIGCLNNLPNDKKQCYAMINQIRTVSKQRLTDFKYKNKYIHLKLNDDQMRIILDGIKELGNASYLLQKDLTMLYK